MEERIFAKLPNGGVLCSFPCSLLVSGSDKKTICPQPGSPTLEDGVVVTDNTGSGVFRECKMVRGDLNDIELIKAREYINAEVELRNIVKAG
jgi:hypothetical protein